MQTDKQQSAVVEALKLATGWLKQCREAGAYVHLGVIAECETALANIAPEPVEAGLVEGLGEALHGLSAMLLLTKALDDEQTHAAYEKVVARFAALTNKDNDHD